jgi:hypothetical protein
MSETAAAPRLPLFYSRLEPVTANRHGNLRIRSAGYGFAREATGIPLAAEEFGVAARTLPIVFGNDAPHMPVALVALAPGANNVVGADGSWAAQTYIPAYVRRYPFLLARIEEGKDDMALCLDPSAPVFSTTEGEPLFPEGKQGPAMERILNLARDYEVAMQRTRLMVDALVAEDLLQPGEVKFTMSGRPARVDGFRAVDRERLARLSPEKLTMFRDRGYLEPLYAHLLSIGGMPALASAAAGQPTVGNA